MRAATIKRIRTSLNLTQRELAAQLGVAVWTVSRWERGAHSPHRVFVEKMKLLRDGKEA